MSTDIDKAINELDTFRQEVRHAMAGISSEAERLAHKSFNEEIRLLAEETLEAVETFKESYFAAMARTRMALGGE